MYLLLYLQAISPGSFPGGEKISHPSWRVGRSVVVGLPGLSWDQNGTSMWVSPFPLSVSYQPVPQRLTCSPEPFLQEQPKKQLWLHPAALQAGSSPSRKLLYNSASAPPFHSACSVGKKKKSLSCTDCSQSGSLCMSGNTMVYRIQ